MEAVSIQVPAALYVSLFQRFGESTTAKIAAYLAELVESEATAESQPSAAVATPYPRPRAGTITGRVWDIADEIRRKFGQVDRAAVIKACMAENMNINTASTQFSYWQKANS
jgi:hypothetical protein